MRSARRRLYPTMPAILFVTLIAYLAFAGWDGNIISIVSGLLLSWFIPGFTLMMVLYPNKLVRINTLVMSFVISLIFDVLVGAALELLNFRLNESGFVVGLWLITITLLTTSNFMRIRGIVSPNRADLKTIYKLLFDKIKKSASGSRSINSNYIVPFILISILLITASWAITINIQAAKTESKPFTALAIESLTADLSEKNFRVVVYNQEKKPMVYRLEMRRDSIVIAEWENIMLDQDEQWVIELLSSQVVEPSDLWLFRSGEDQPYRQVHLFIP